MHFETGLKLLVRQLTLSVFLACQCHLYFYILDMLDRQFVTQLLGSYRYVLCRSYVTKVIKTTKKEVAWENQVSRTQPQFCERAMRATCVEQKSIVKVK